jgi:mannose-6-phosphate isomerase class I
MGRRKYGYGNYDLHPCKKITGFDQCVFDGAESLVSELLSGKNKKKTVIVCDCYPGTDKEEIISWFQKYEPLVIDTDSCAYPGEKLTELFSDYLLDDRVFGIMCHKTLEECFDPEEISFAKEKVQKVREGLVLVIGTGASFITYGDVYLYFDLARWEIQLRYRAGMPNWNCDNTDAPVLSKVKRGFFIEWRLADRYKKARFERFDYVVDTNEKNHPKMITGKAFREGLKQISTHPFRLKPYFDPGVWGGQWMKETFELPKEEENYAWSFDGVPEENSILLKYGNVTVELPCMDLVLYCPEPLLGSRVHARFGAEFPIRFDLLDTMEGGNLSLQVHPLTEYIQDTFGMHYTQDESYYILDAKEDSCVYLGLKENIDREAMIRQLKQAERGEISFPAEDYVNKIPVKKHDHVLIPAGTIHCSGKDTMVLEISATPYIFTFKLWDWGRVGLDGIPRPIHVDRGVDNIQWNRDTQWVMDNLVGQQQIKCEEKGILVERTGLHEREFIDTYRYTVDASLTCKANGSVHMLNLVKGEAVIIESPSKSFPPFEVHYAETFIIPASAGDYIINPVKPDIDGQVSVIDAWVR